MDATVKPRKRAQRWGADVPADDDEARERILDAAERCYRRFGIDRTRMDDIAREVGVHRTTIYTYFPNKDAVLAGAFLREALHVLALSDPILRGDGSFEDRLVRAAAVALAATRESQYMTLLLDPSVAAQTFHAAEASELWRARVADSLEPVLQNAVALGEVRSDVGVDQMLRWVWRVAFSLASEPPDERDGGDIGVITKFLLPSLRA